MPSTLYDEDFFSWTADTANKVREGRFDDIELAALAQEIEELGKRDWREVNSRLKVILVHLLKIEFQPKKKTASWVESVSRERDELESIFEQSPSLKAEGGEAFARTYERVVREAARETGVPALDFPATCRYTYDQTLDPSFYPAAGEKEVNP